MAAEPDAKPFAGPERTSAARNVGRRDGAAAKRRLGGKSVHGTLRRRLHPSVAASKYSRGIAAPKQ